MLFLPNGKVVYGVTQKDADIIRRNLIEKKIPKHHRHADFFTLETRAKLVDDTHVGA